MNWESIATLAGAVFGSQFIIELARGFITKSSEKATAAKIQSEADATAADKALEYANLLTKRLDKLESELDLLRKENLQLHKEVAALRTEVNFYKTFKPVGVVPMPEIPPNASPTGIS